MHARDVNNYDYPTEEHLKNNSYGQQIADKELDYNTIELDTIKTDNRQTYSHIYENYYNNWIKSII